MLAIDNKNTSTAKSFNAKIKKRLAIISEESESKAISINQIVYPPSFAIDPILINN
jgi:hypothetical protein